MAAKSKPEVYVARESGSVDIDGIAFVFVKGATFAEVGSEVLKRVPSAFVPIVAHYRADKSEQKGLRPAVEQATAAPGEKRGDK